MKRQDFLKGVGILGLGSMLPFRKAAAVPKGTGVGCTLIPSETEGPFPLDLTENSYYFRQDIREDRTGVELHVKLRIIGENNCLPMSNVRVNIWHCDKDGVYSGYDSAMNPGGSADTKWLRGYQMTDADGMVEFITIFPGHYDGRVTHIHFQVYVSSIYHAVSQLTWDETTKNNFYTAHSSIYTEGTDTTSLSSDGVFSDGYTLQLASLTDNGDGTYDAAMDVTIAGTGATGLINYEGETGGHFKMGQNFPNPYIGVTTIPFSLNTASEVQIDLFDVNAKKMAVIKKGSLSPGDHSILIDCKELGIPAANYIYQLEVKNDKGIFRQCKMMTAVK